MQTRNSPRATVSQVADAMRYAVGDRVSLSRHPTIRGTVCRATAHDAGRGLVAVELDHTLCWCDGEKVTNVVTLRPAQIVHVIYRESRQDTGQAALTKLELVPLEHVTTIPMRAWRAS